MIVIFKDASVASLPPFLSSSALYYTYSIYRKHTINKACKYFNLKYLIRYMCDKFNPFKGTRRYIIKEHIHARTFAIEAFSINIPKSLFGTREHLNLNWIFPWGWRRRRHDAISLSLHAYIVTQIVSGAAD